MRNRNYSTVYHRDWAVGGRLTNVDLTYPDLAFFRGSNVYFYCEYFHPPIPIWFFFLKFHTPWHWQCTFHWRILSERIHPQIQWGRDRETVLVIRVECIWMWAWLTYRNQASMIFTIESRKGSVTFLINSLSPISVAHAVVHRAQAM